MLSPSGHSPAATWTDALRRFTRPEQIFLVVVVAYCSTCVFESFQKAAADPVSFAFDITAYIFSLYVASFLLKIAFQFAKGTIANLTEA